MVKLSNPLVPKDSNVKLAVTVALTNASLSSFLVSSPSPEERKAAMVPANESPQPVGSTTFSVGYAGNEIISLPWKAVTPFSPF